MYVLCSVRRRKQQQEHQQEEKFFFVALSITFFCITAAVQRCSTSLIFRFCCLSVCELFRKLSLKHTKIKIYVYASIRQKQGELKIWQIKTVYRFFLNIFFVMCLLMCLLNFFVFFTFISISLSHGDSNTRLLDSKFSTSAIRPQLLAKLLFKVTASLSVNWHWQT